MIYFMIAVFLFMRSRHIIMMTVNLLRATASEQRARGTCCAHRRVRTSIDATPTQPQRARTAHGRRTRHIAMSVIKLIYSARVVGRTRGR